MIRENLAQIYRHMEHACQKSGRDPEDVRLIVVSKTQPVPMLMEAYACGCRDFGENRVQELIQKYEEMPKDVRWHMIGHLQRNKVKYIIGKAALIHSVDSLKLAQEISREAVRAKTEMSILIQVNAAEEESKFGVSLQDAEALIREAAKLPQLHIKGLMTIAPYVQNPEENRQYFEQLRQLSVDINNKSIDNVNMNVLSMGMTGDYETAIYEGASHIRVGTGVFGRRNYPVK